MPISIFEDNEGAIKQANSNILNNANRTIALKFHHVREEITEGRIKLLNISSQDQLADALTKSLQPGRLVQLRDRIMGTDSHWWSSKLSELKKSGEKILQTTATSSSLGDAIPESDQPDKGCHLVSMTLTYSAREDQK
jgi:hypothetical protein